MENNKKYKRWLLQCLLVSLALMLGGAGFNYLVDPYGVFHTELGAGFNSNKARYLFDGMTKFYALKKVNPGAILIGTSRIEYLDPKDIEKYTGTGAYNLGITGANIYEQYIYFKYVAEHYNIRHAVIGLDWEAFFSGKAREVFGENRLRDTVYLKDYADALFSGDTLGNSWLTIKANVNKTPLVIDFRTGMTVAEAFYIQVDKGKGRQLIRDRIEATLAQKTAQYNKLGGRKGAERILKNVDYLRKILEIARAKNISIKVFLTPIHVSNFDLIYSMNMGDAFENWKREVSKVTGFYDFTGYNSITKDMGWWIDSNHIQAKGGSLIFARLFNDGARIPYKDFGVLVGRHNIEEHLEKLRNGIDFSRPQPPKWEGRWADNWISKRARCLLKNYRKDEVIFSGYVTQHTLPSTLIITQGAATKRVSLDKAGYFSFSIHLPPGKKDSVDIEFSTDRTFNPKSMGSSGDSRNLSVQLKLQVEEDWQL